MQASTLTDGAAAGRGAAGTHCQESGLNGASPSIYMQGMHQSRSHVTGILPRKLTLRNNGDGAVSMSELHKRGFDVMREVQY